MVNILFMGRKPVAAQALEWLCGRPDVNVVGVITDSHLSVSPTRDLAIQHRIPVLSRLLAEEQISAGDIQIDLALSVLYWQKIRAPLLQGSRRGVINFHPAPLPEYKGTAGYNLAILEGLNEWAVSAHYVDAEIDTGDIIEVHRFPMDAERETAQSLERKSQPELLGQFQRVVGAALEADGLLPASPNIGGRYISRAQMEAMKRIQNGDDVPRKIRAFWFPPYDGAYLEFGGEKCTLVTPQILQSLADPSVSSLFTSPTTDADGGVKSRGK